MRECLNINKLNNKICYKIHKLQLNLKVDIVIEVKNLQLLNYNDIN